MPDVINMLKSKKRIGFRYLPNTTKSKSLSVLPATFVAVHVYLAESGILTRIIFKCVLLCSNLMLSVSRKAMPFTAHVIRGGGIAVIGQPIVAVSFTIIWSVSARPDPSILGGTEMKCIVL